MTNIGMSTPKIITLKPKLQNSTGRSLLLSHKNRLNSACSDFNVSSRSTNNCIIVVLSS